MLSFARSNFRSFLYLFVSCLTASDPFQSCGGRRRVGSERVPAEDHPQGSSRRPYFAVPRPILPIRPLGQFGLSRHCHGVWDMDRSRWIYAEDFPYDIFSRLHSACRESDSIAPDLVSILAYFIESVDLSTTEAKKDLLAYWLTTSIPLADSKQTIRYS